MSPFSAPFSGALKNEGFCFQSERLLYGRDRMGCDLKHRLAAFEPSFGRSSLVSPLDPHSVVKPWL
jgi:hypothetical protein